MKVDIFCRVIDNYGDAGVCYRLGKELIGRYDDIYIRIITDNIEPFKLLTGINNSPIITSKMEISDRYCGLGDDIEPGDVIIEAFGCDIPLEYEDKIDNVKTWINLEYMTCEEWGQEYHLKKSINSKGIEKYFYVPGIGEGLGGLIFNGNEERSRKILQKDLITGVIFTYENDFTEFIGDLEKVPIKIKLQIFGEKSKKSFREYFGAKKINYDGKRIVFGNIIVEFIENVVQQEFDDYIKNADFCIIRGEDSFSRAVIYGKPFIWDIYKQEKNIHFEKLDGFIKKAEKYFDNKKTFEKYRNMMYNYNCVCTEKREVKTNYSDICISYLEYSEAAGKMMDDVRNNYNLVENIYNLIKRSE